MAKKLRDIIPYGTAFDSGDIPDAELFINTCDVSGVDISKETKSATLKLSSSIYAGSAFLDEIGEYIRKSTGLAKVQCELSVESSDSASYFDIIAAKLCDDFPNLSPVLEGALAEENGNMLEVTLKHNGAELLALKKADEYIASEYSARFGRKINVKFICDSKAESMSELIKKEITKKASEQKDKRKPGKIKVLLGRNINTQSSQIPMSPAEDDDLTIEGEVFNYETRKLNSGKLLISFVITDRIASVYVKAIFDEAKHPHLAGFSGNEEYLKIRGKVQHDTYLKEKVLMARDICRAERNMRADSATEKRIELHAHTQMSALDGISDTAKLVERAALWGHSAIAITDHGGLYAYPEAFQAAKKHDIKIIYGIEGYLSDGPGIIVHGSDERDINSGYTVVDIETTGLSLKYDMITEVGAVRIRNGNITETFNEFVNPGIPIPAKVSEITGITNTMVSGARDIRQIMPELLAFIGEDCIVAHNANFDMTIIKREAEKAGYQLSNPVLDTLELSRALFPEIKRHRLSTIARRLGVNVENTHRAFEDAVIAAGVLKKMFDIIAFKKNISKLSELNGLTEGQNAHANSKIYHVILLAADKVGLKNLYKIVSRSQLEYFNKKPRIPKELLIKFRQGLLVGSACESGEIYQAILENRDESELVRLAEFYDYLEIQPTGNNLFMVRNGLVKDEAQLKNINKKIINIGKLAGKKTVATCDLHFIDPEDAIFREIILTGEGYEDARYQTPLYFRTTQEMLDEFSYLGDELAQEVVVTNTQYVNSLIENIAPIPKGTFPPKIQDSDNELRRMSCEKAEKIYGKEPHPKVSERMEKELDSIIRHGFSVMYIIAGKLVKKSLDDGYLVGSRGSVGSSLVAFLAGITEVNALPPHYLCGACQYTEFIEDGSVECGFDLPDKNCPECGAMLGKDGYDIPFETFLGFDGDKEPDIDLNFSGQYQSKAHKYIEELFGKDHVFRAGTVSKLAEQTAYGYVKKFMELHGLEMPRNEIDRLSKGCMGVRKTSGQHPGGIMIIPQDMEIYDFTAIGHPADDTESEIITTHFDYRFLHGSILKLDILGHDDPTMINMLEKFTGIKSTGIIPGDRNVMEIFRSTGPLGASSDEIGSEVGTLGIPEFGTAFVRGMLVETKPETYAELVKISGLSHGTDVWIGNAQKLIKEKTTTLKNAICCRDDIMIYLISAGVTPASAFKIMENVRKGKGLTDEMTAEMKKCKVPDWYIWSCVRIKYMFPKAHAAAYVSMAFRIAWYKVNEPLAYYAAYFSTRCDEFDAKMMIHGAINAKEYLRRFREIDKVTQGDKNVITILEVVVEMYARGFEFLSVDLYISDAFDFIPENGKIRPPLRSIAGLGGNAAANIVRERVRERFISIEDLCQRAKVSKTMADAMTDEGCLAGMPESNQLSLF